MKYGLQQTFSFLVRIDPSGGLAALHDQINFNHFQPPHAKHPSSSLGHCHPSHERLNSSVDHCHPSHERLNSSVDYYPPLSLLAAVAPDIVVV
jgi:hypothetical protein